MDYAPHRYKLRARRMRREATKEETILWPLLRAKRFAGLKFRRQHEIAMYIADFACVSLKLAIELDGAGHQERLEEDARRDGYLHSIGWTVLRFGNHEVESMLHPVLETIWEAMRRLSEKRDFPSP